jgi:hypothetical protein
MQLPFFDSQEIAVSSTTFFFFLCNSQPNLESRHPRSSKNLTFCWRLQAPASSTVARVSIVMIAAMQG